MDTNITKTWTIEISEKEIFARCINESLYQAYVRAESNSKGDAIVIQDDDYGQFHTYFNIAISNLHMILSRRMTDLPYPCGCDNDRAFSFELHMHDNHDDNMLPILIIHCKEYIIKKVLEQWYHVSFGSELERLEINHCIHYRKNPVRRRIGPLF